MSELDDLASLVRAATPAFDPKVVGSRSNSSSTCWWTRMKRSSAGASNASRDALDRAGIARRIAFTSASLAGTWAAVGAGLGVSVAHCWACRRACVRPVREACLPSLPMLGLSLYRAQAEPVPAVLQLQALLRQAIEGAPAT